MDFAFVKINGSMLNPGNEKNFLFNAIVISIVSHILFFVIMLLVPKPSYQRQFVMPSISVRMVSIPEQSYARSDPVESTTKAIAAKKTLDTPAIPSTKPKSMLEIKKPEVKLKQKTEMADSDSAPEPEVSLAPKQIKVKKSLKKKTYKPAEVVKRAIDKIEKETKDEKPRAIADAIEKIKREIPESRPVDTSVGTKPKTTAARPSRYSGYTTGSAVRSGFIAGQLDVYNAEIIFRIQRNWAFSEQLARKNKALEALIGIKIMPNGEIRDVWFDKRSGNKLLDESAYRAIKKTNPLPPMPKDFLEPHYVIGLRFTPEGLVPSR
jgi:colicin import membrane protein